MGKEAREIGKVAEGTLADDISWCKAEALVAAQWDDMLELPTGILALNNASRGNDIDLESD